MRKTALLIVLAALVFAPIAEAKSTVYEKAARFAAKDARAEGASGYSVDRCRRRRCWVTLYGIWSPMVDGYADLSGVVVVPKRGRPYWRDFV